MSDNEYIHLKELIEHLEQMPQDGVLPFGFGEPMSYRGYYEELAFEPKKDAVISEMLAHAKSAEGNIFYGYKGGEYRMNPYSDCYIASYGCSGGDKIGLTLINMWKIHLKLANKEE